MGAGDQRRPWAELSPQEQTERRREAARKAAATRARNRARQAEQVQRAADAAALDQPAGPSSDVVVADPVVPEVPQAAGVDHAVDEPAPVAPEPEDEPAPVVPEPGDGPAPVVPEPGDEPHDAVAVVPQPEDAVVEPAPVGPQAEEEPAVDVAPDIAHGAPAVLLRLEGVTRSFGRTRAVEGIDLEVRAGECHAIVGLNGAGKSTTVSLAAGLMRPSSGSVEVGGRDVRERGVQSQLGIVPDRMRLFDRLTGRQLLVHTAMLRRVPKADAVRRAATLLERFELTPDADRLVADYSIGMQQLVGIAAALIHAPRVVVLDEPFESIDPVATDTILAVLDDLRRNGGAVVLTSHDMALVERACDHVLVLHDGVVRASGPMDEVRDGLPLEDRFARLVGASTGQELPWLSPSHD